MPVPLALLLAMAVCAAIGAGIQHFLYDRLERRRATHLVVLIASLGALAVIQNLIAALYSPNILQFPWPWAAKPSRSAGSRLTNAQLLTLAIGAVRLSGGVAGSRIARCSATACARSPPTRSWQRSPGCAAPMSTSIVIAIASAIVCLPGVLVPLDLGLQPYGGITVLLTATIAMIAGGVGSISGAFLLSLVIAVLQNLSLLVMPGEWSIGVTFFIFVIFMLLRPRGLFAAR